MPQYEFSMPYLEAINVEKKINIYMAHFYPIWIEDSGVMLSHDPFLPLKKPKPAE